MMEDYSNRNGRWGPWEMDTDGSGVMPALITYYPYEYRVDLRECQTSAQVLDIIMQLTSKGWPDYVIAGFVRAISDVLKPQENLCSWGKNKKLTLKRIKELGDKHPVNYLDNGSGRHGVHWYNSDEFYPPMSQADPELSAAI